MPELPEVACRAEEMRRELIGRTITAIEVLQPKCLNLPPDEFCRLLTGGRVVGVSQRGKWILAETTRGWLLLNLGMGGEVLLVTPQTLPAKYRLLFHLDDGHCLAVNFWWFGYAHHARAPSEHPMVGKLGPDALELTLGQFRTLLKGRRGMVKSFLLDQDRIAGIGNVYVQDSLFRARIHPLRPIHTLGDDEIAALWQAIRDTLQESIDQGGAPFELDLYGQKGRWSASFLVGYREGQPCTVCGTPVVKIKSGSTSSYICPSCQTLDRG